MKEATDGVGPTVNHTSPGWRLFGVALFFGGVGFLGWWAQQIGWVDQFSTVLVITLFFSVSFWARKRPDRFRRRFGPFGLIADAVRKSGDRIREDVYARPMRFGVALAVGYGIAVVAAKALVVAVITNVYAWPLAAAAACIVGAQVVAPEYFSKVWDKLSVSDEEDLKGTDGGPDVEDENEIERARRRRAAGEE